MVDAIAGEDPLLKVTIEGDASALLEQMKDQVAEWNQILDDAP